MANRIYKLIVFTQVSIIFAMVLLITAGDRILLLANSG